jgi:hypothetical protein
VLQNIIDTLDVVLYLFVVLPLSIIIATSFVWRWLYKDKF